MSRDTKPTDHPIHDIGIELVVALARQIPTLEADALVRTITTSEQVRR